MSELSTAQLVSMLEHAEARIVNGSPVLSIPIDQLHAFTHSTALQRGSDIPERWEKWGGMPDEMFVDVATDEVIVKGGNRQVVRLMLAELERWLDVGHTAWEVHTESLRDPNAFYRARTGPEKPEPQLYGAAIDTAVEYSLRTAEHSRIRRAVPKDFSRACSLSIRPDGTAWATISNQRTPEWRVVPPPEGVQIDFTAEVVKDNPRPSNTSAEPGTELSGGAKSQNALRNILNTLARVFRVAK